MKGTPFDDKTWAARRLSQLCDECEELENRYYSRTPFTDRSGLRQRIDELHKLIAGAANLVANEAHAARPPHV